MAMRRFPIFIATLMAMALAIVSCGDDDNTWDDYAEYRQANIDWLQQQYEKKDASGKPVYTMLRPTWDQGSYVLIRYFNDTMLTKDNPKPFLTSTVDVKYHGSLYDGTPFDSSYLRTAPADSIYRTKLTDVVGGWVIALTTMHKGDSCEVIIPCEQGYGSIERTGIPPYSALVFGIKLVDIYKQEK